MYMMFGKANTLPRRPTLLPKRILPEKIAVLSEITLPERATLLPQRVLFDRATVVLKKDSVLPGRLH